MLPEETFSAGRLGASSTWVSSSRRPTRPGPTQAMAGLEIWGGVRTGTAAGLAMTGRRRLRVCVRGVVQGVGFRPFVYTTRRRAGLAGTVRNDSAGAVIEVEGDGPRRRSVPDDGCATSRRRWPWSIEPSKQDVPLVGGTGFAIADTTRPDGGRTLASPDVAMCADCAAELRDPGRPALPAPVHQLHQLRAAVHDHRARCPTTGPPRRWPASRCAPTAPASTTTPPTGVSTPSRSACPDCGPTAALPSTGRPTDRTATPALRARPTAAARRRHRRGQGHRRLPPGLRRAPTTRRSPNCGTRKRRGDKPFARDGRRPRRRRAADRRRRRRRGRAADRHRSARSCCSHAAGRQPVADAVAPGNPDLGVMLPYTPLHVAAVRTARRRRRARTLLVMTSRQPRRRADRFTDDDARRPARAARRRVADARPARSRCRATTR